jgi:translation initiation factor IF-2
MTDNTENKPKLTLKTPKLSLSKPLLSRPLESNLLKNPAPRQNSVTVEVKRGLVSKPTKILSSENAIERTDSSVLNSRINLLKRAAQDSKQKEIEEEKIQKAFAERNTAIREEIRLEREREINKEIPQENYETHPNKTSQSSSTQNSELEEEQKLLSKPVAIKPKEDVETKLEEKPVVKVKKEEPRKLHKNHIFELLSADDDSAPRQKTRSLASIKRAREKEKRKLESVKQEKVYRDVTIPEIITVGELASRMSERVADVIKELMKMGMIANSSQTIDADTAELVVGTMGHTYKRIQESDVENILVNQPDDMGDMIQRAPVVTVMGHVDHGKTSLLDALKSTDIAAGEAGGITQHIGAYRVNLKSGNSITFIDTPGHEAFTEMRSRGAKVTDVVVLVVAADDGIMAQTIEAINHAKAAKVPIIVAINKIDKPDADINRVKNELLSHDLVPEEFGGDIVVVPVSAKARTNIDKLEESILLVAEMADLKANPNSNASGSVVESKIDKAKGVIATLLVQRGTLKVGDLIVAGSSYGRVKKLIDDKGHNIEKCMPSMPAEVWGLSSAPLAGEQFSVVETEKQARDIAEYRERKASDKRLSQVKKSSLEELFSKATGEGAIKELPIIIKGDVQGSIEAIVSSLGKIVSSEVKIKILHTAVGGITESDVALANASKGIIIGFNVRAGSNVAISAERAGVDIRYYSIIYNLIDDIKSIVSGMLKPIIREEYIGSVEIRVVFNITKVGKIAGSYVTKGTIKRGAGVRLLRDNIVIHEGKLKTLKRFKDDVKEVRENYECGIAFENYEDIKIGDMVEVFEIIEEKQKL